VHAAPSDATLVLDDARLNENPFDGAFASDGLQHRLQASAPGFLPETRLVPFEGGDVTIDVVLQKAPAAAPAHGSKATGAGTAPSRPKLEDDPWK
jgi:hypothetical protein